MPISSEKAKAHKRQHDRDAYRAKRQAGRPANRGAVHTYKHRRKQQLRRNFGLTLAGYDGLLRRQNGVCAICNRPETRLRSSGSVPKALAVDHDHATRRIRGLLCHDCNIGLGLFGDSIDCLLAATRYLLAHQ